MSEQNKQKKPTQPEIVDSYLMTGAAVSQLEACYPRGLEIYPNAERFGLGWYITDLAGCIKILKKGGAEVEKINEKNPLTGSHYVRYKYTKEYIIRKRREKMQPVQLKMF